MVSPASDPPPTDTPPTSGTATFTLDGCERAGDEFVQNSQHEAAIEEYKRALLLLGSDRGPRRAGLYVKLGNAARTLGKPRIALNNLVKALGLEPLNDPAYEAALELSRAARDYVTIDELQRKRIGALDSAADKARLWRQNAELWSEEARDPARAVAAVELWLEDVPKDREALRQLASLRSALGHHEHAIKALADLAEVLSGSESAAVFFEAAKLAHEKLTDEALALGLVGRALVSDPEAEEPFRFAQGLLNAASDWQRLCALCEQVGGASRVPERKLQCFVQAYSLARDKLTDLVRAELCLAHALEIDDDDPKLLRALAQVRLEQAAYDRAIVSCRESLEVEPRSHESFQLAFEIFQRGGNSDGAFNAALVLDYLGHAEINQSLLADTHRPAGLLAPEGVLTDEDWQAGLLFPERDRGLQAALEFLTPAAIAAKLELTSKKKQAFELDEEERQDLEASTATLVRSLKWATGVLGIEAPALFLRAELNSEIVAVRVSERAILADRSLGSGLDLKQLAFLWGRSLSEFRPENYLAVHYPTEQELVLLLQAAKLACRGKAASAPAGEVKTLALLLEQSFEPARRKELARLLKAVSDTEEAAEDWLVSCELCCARAGLLACGDLAEAARLSERFAFGNVTEPAAQIDELLQFGISDEYATLRKRLGVAVSG